MKYIPFNKFRWSFDIKGSSDSIQAYFRHRRGNASDNEFGCGVGLMPRRWQFEHHRSACRFNICLWIIHFWFDYPYPIIPKPQHCRRCNKTNPDPKENCWVGSELCINNPVPHILENNTNGETR